MRRFYTVFGVVTFVGLLFISNWAYESAAMVDINTADREKLVNLPGIGQVLADRIIENRPIESWEQLAKIDGFGNQRLRAIEGKVRLP